MSTGSRRPPSGAAGSSATNTSAVRAIGARNQKTAGQPQMSTSSPPISGPPADPSAYIIVKAASARLRRSSGNKPVTKAGAQLRISAAPIPCKNRQNSSQPKLGAAAQQTNSTAFHNNPSRNTRP